MSKPCRLDIDRIAFFGRTYAEYLDMFGLDEAMLASGRILDCPGGASSFTYEAYRKGFDVTACDALYGLSAVNLFDKGQKDISHVFEKFDEVSRLYVWNYYRSKDHVMTLRKKALDLFVEDYSGCTAEGRYIPAELPNLPFADGTFSLVLSAHLLFLYNDRLNIEFHKASLRELLRVCSGEVRIFPLVGLDAKLYPQINEILDFVAAEGVDAEIVKVPLEFQKGSGRMLKLIRRVNMQEGYHEN